MDKIFIDGLRLMAVIGVEASERAAAQPLRADIEMQFDCRSAGASDRIADTVDYARVAALLTQICAAGEYRLVEALAETMCRQVLDAFPISAISLRLGKLQVLRDAACVGVQIERSREASVRAETHATAGTV